MIIKTNTEGKVILQNSADVALDGGYIVHMSHEMPIDEETHEPKPEEGVVYVDGIPTVPQGYDLYFDGVEFSLHENPNYAEAKIRAGYINELRAIKRWFFDTDWHHNKITAGEWTKDHEDWLAYLAERTEKRARQDEVLALLKIEKSEQKAFLAAL